MLIGDDVCLSFGADGHVQGLYTTELQHASELL